MKALICVFPLVKRTVENVRTFCLHGINWIFGVCQNVEAKRQQTENVNIHRDTTRHTDDADSRAHSRANFTYGCTESDISETAALTSAAAPAAAAEQTKQHADPIRPNDSCKHWWRRDVTTFTWNVNSYRRWKTQPPPSYGRLCTWRKVRSGARLLMLGVGSVVGDWDCRPLADMTPQYPNHDHRQSVLSHNVFSLSLFLMGKWERQENRLFWFTDLRRWFGHPVCHLWKLFKWFCLDG